MIVLKEETVETRAVPGGHLQPGGGEDQGGGQEEHGGEEHQ